MPFRQEPPRLGNQYETDRALRSYLGRARPPEALAGVDRIEVSPLWRVAERLAEN